LLQRQQEQEDEVLVTDAEALRILAGADTTADAVREAVTRLQGEPLSALAEWNALEDDIELVTAIGGKIPFPLRSGTTTFVVRLVRAIYIRADGVFARAAILDAVQRGSGPAAGARMLDLAAVNGGRS
jgi:hypothetical protein